MDESNKDYAFKNEISLSIGVDGVDSSATSTPSTVTPTSPPTIPVIPIVPTPSPRQNLINDSDTKPLTKSDKMPMGGVDNKGFDETETPVKKSVEPISRPLTSFGNGHSNGLNESSTNGVNGSSKNGQLNEKKLAEAVNLELININSNNNLKKPTSTNGKHNELPMKKDVDVEAGHSYDGEYFVPVNEHKKYMSIKKRPYSRKTRHGIDSASGLSVEAPAYGVMDYNQWLNTTTRGEKLVVTKDTRSKSKKNKLCWALCLGVIAAAIILAILALAGVFSKTEPTPVEARQFGDKDVKTGSIFPVASGDNAANDTTERILPYETTPLSEPSSTTDLNEDEDDDDPFSSINYVDNSLEGQVTLMEATYDPQYDDKNSEEYKNMVSELESEIKKILNKDNSQKYHVKILDLKPGSIVVNYRIGWDESETQMTEDDLKEKLTQYLTRNTNFLGRHVVSIDTIRVARVPDQCFDISSPLNCDNGCYFDEKKVDFSCKCDGSMYFDERLKECIPKVGFEHMEGDHDHDHSHHDHDHSHHDHDHSHHDHDHIHHVYSSTAEPEPSSSAEPEPSSSAEPEPSSSAEPEPSSSAEPEPSSSSEPEPSSSAEPEPSSSAEPEPSSSSEPEPTSSSEPEPSSSSEPSSKAEPETSSNSNITKENSHSSTEESKHIHDHSHHNHDHDHSHHSHDDDDDTFYIPSSSAEPPTNSEISRIAESSIITKGLTSSESNHTSNAEPEPSSTSEPSSKKEHEKSSNPEPSNPEPTSSSEPEPSSSSEPEPSSSSEPEPSSSSEPEPSSSSEPEPSSSSEPEPSSSSEPEPSSSSEPEPSSTSANKDSTSKLLKIEHEHTPSSSAEPEPSSSAEPEPSSSAEPEPSSSAEPEPSSSAKPEPSSSAEPEPSSEPRLSKDSSHLEKSTSTTIKSIVNESKPVIEIVDDTPMPTEKYVTMHHHSESEQNIIDVFNANTTTTQIPSNNIYSTSNPIHLWNSDNSTQAEHSENLHDMSPFLPSVEKGSYSVTENISESNSHIQSPFLPDAENNETLNHIYMQQHEHGIIEEIEDGKKSEPLPVVPLTTTTAASITTDSGHEDSSMLLTTTPPLPKRTTSTSIRVLENFGKSLKHSTDSGHDEDSDESVEYTPTPETNYEPTTTTSTTTSTKAPEILETSSASPTDSFEFKEYVEVLKNSTLDDNADLNKILERVVSEKDSLTTTEKTILKEFIEELKNSTIDESMNLNKILENATTAKSSTENPVVTELIEVLKNSTINENSSLKKILETVEMAVTASSATTEQALFKEIVEELKNSTSDENSKLEKILENIENADTTENPVIKHVIDELKNSTVDEKLQNLEKVVTETIAKLNETNQEQSTNIEDLVKHVLNSTIASLSATESSPATFPTSESVSVSISSTSVSTSESVSSSPSGDQQNTATTKKYSESIDELLKTKDLINDDNYIDSENDLKVLPLSKSIKTTDSPYLTTDRSEHTTSHSLLETTFYLNNLENNEKSLHFETTTSRKDSD